MEKKPGALDQTAPLREWKLDPAFDALRRLLEARFGPRGKREYIQTLRLLLARIKRRPAHLDLSRYPHLPQLRERCHHRNAERKPRRLVH